MVLSSYIDLVVMLVVQQIHEVVGGIWLPQSEMVRRLYVFVSSPSDVADERTAVCKVIHKIDSLFQTENVDVRAAKWEDISPDAGEPQAIINPLVDRCDCFIGILARRWGTPTGRYSSGFEEEFYRALERRRGGNAPKMAIFLANLSQDEMEAPDAQLRMVLDFREKLKTERLVLYGTYNSVDDLASQVETTLHNWTLGITRKPSAARSQRITAVIAVLTLAFWLVFGMPVLRRNAAAPQTDSQPQPISAAAETASPSAATTGSGVSNITPAAGSTDVTSREGKVDDSVRGSLSGVAFDNSSPPKRVSGITLRIRRQDGPPYHSAVATTQADGSYFVSGLPAGTYMVQLDDHSVLRITPDGVPICDYKPVGYLFGPDWQSGSEWMSTQRTWSVTDSGPSVSADLHLHRAPGSITVRAVSQDGSPLEAVRVKLYGDRVLRPDRNGGYVSWNETRADGAVTFLNCPLGWYTISCPVIENELDRSVWVPHEIAVLLSEDELHKDITITLKPIGK